MKKLILATYLGIAVATAATAQITFQHEYDPNLRIYKMANGDVKFIETYAPNGYTNVIQVYNSDHSLYKTVTFPADTSNKEEVRFQHVSDQLFNTDGKLEFILNYSIGSTYMGVRIYNEDTVLIFSKDSVQFRVGTDAIFKDATGFKMVLARMKPHPTQPWLWNTAKMMIYSLPGTLPLMAKPVEPVNKLLHIADPFPNPAVNEKVIIPYALPDGVERGDIIFTDLNGKEVRTFTVTHTFNTLELDGQLPHGTYFYQLKAGTVATGAKKLIVIK